VVRVAECFTRAGFKAPVLDNIRAEIWLKAWGNLSFNPISALTRAELAEICQFAPTRALAAAMMSEAQVVAGRLGISFHVPLEKRIAGAEKVGKHKTSMLQDIEAGRAPEIESTGGIDRRAGAPDAYADPQHRCGLRAGRPAGAHGGRTRRRGLKTVLRWVRFSAANGRVGFGVLSPCAARTRRPALRPTAYTATPASIWCRAKSYDTFGCIGPGDHCRA